MTDHTALRETLERTLRDRFGTGPNRAADEGFSEVVIAEILAALMPPIAAALEQAREQAAERAIEEHENALCPEDVGCKELIDSLDRKVAEYDGRIVALKKAVDDFCTDSIREHERADRAEAQIAALRDERDELLREGVKWISDRAEQDAQIAALTTDLLRLSYELRAYRTMWAILHDEEIVNRSTAYQLRDLLLAESADAEPELRETPALPPRTQINARPTWNQILTLALFDPLVHRALTLERQGALSREEALMAALIELSRDNKNWKDREINRLREAPASPSKPHFWTPNETNDTCIICGDGVWGRHRFQVQPEKRDDR